MKYSLVCRYLVDRTIDAKGMKTNESEEVVRAFLNMIVKRNRTKQIEVQKGTEFTGEFKNFLIPKEQNNILQWVKPRLQLLNIRYDPKKLFFNVSCKTIGKKSHRILQFFIVLNSWKNCSIEAKRCQKTRVFVHFSQPTSTRVLEE